MPKRSGHLTRREVVLAGLASVPLIGCGLGSRARSQAGRRSAGSTNGLTADTWVEREIQLVEKAGPVGRLTVFVRLRGKRAAALSSRCTCRPEEGSCPVRWIESTRHFVCPCHGGIYDERGAAAGGPPKQGLERLPATVEGDTVFVRRS